MNGWIIQTFPHLCELRRKKHLFQTQTASWSMFLTLPPPGVCFRLSLEPQRAWTLAKSSFLSRIWTCKVRERKKKIKFSQSEEEGDCRERVSPEGGNKMWKGWKLDSFPLKLPSVTWFNHCHIIKEPQEAVHGATGGCSSDLSAWKSTIVQNETLVVNKS